MARVTRSKKEIIETATPILQDGLSEINSSQQTMFPGYNNGTQTDPRAFVPPYQNIADYRFDGLIKDIDQIHLVLAEIKAEMNEVRNNIKLLNDDHIALKTETKSNFKWQWIIISIMFTIIGAVIGHYIVCVLPEMHKIDNAVSVNKEKINNLEQNCRQNLNKK